METHYWCADCYVCLSQCVCVCLSQCVCVNRNNRDPLLMCNLLCVSFTVRALVCVLKGTIEVHYCCAVYCVCLSQCVCQREQQRSLTDVQFAMYSFHSVCVKGTIEISH